MHDASAGHRPRLARFATPGLLALVLLVGGGNLWATYDQVGTVRAAEAASARNAASVAQLCQAGNASRAQQITLWDHFAAISKPPPHQTAAQAAARQKSVAAILAYIRRVFAPRDCAQPGRAAGR
jgi:hypothetical protein